MNDISIIISSTVSVISVVGIAMSLYYTCMRKKISIKVKKDKIEDDKRVENISSTLDKRQISLNDLNNFDEDDIFHIIDNLVENLDELRDDQIFLEKFINDKITYLGIEQERINLDNQEKFDILVKIIEDGL